MIIFKNQGPIRDYLDACRKDGKTIGFVPTMGALHAGHISLIARSKSETQITVCSIFVNPTQFNDKKDFEKYPITLAADIRLLEAAGCDVLYLPDQEEIYPGGLEALPIYDLGFLETVFEGKFRPGHFQGVCQVVDILLSRVSPDFLFLGQKDFQQCMVISRLIDIRNGKKPRVIICPTLREENGLAMSSRNRRLSEEGREKAGLIYKQLSHIRKEYQAGTKREPLLESASKALEAEGFTIDYLDIVDARKLETQIEDHAVILVAVFFEGVRLIDNLIID